MLLAGSLRGTSVVSPIGEEAIRPAARHVLLGGSVVFEWYCPDDKKYAVVEAMVKEYSAMHEKGEKLLGQKIVSVVTVNGVRVTLEDGTWGLVRASSNKPSLVVVVESPASEANMRAILKDIDTRLGKFPEVGEYDQKI